MGDDSASETKLILSVLWVVQTLVAAHAYCDQVLDRIIAGPTAKLLVMNLQILRSAAQLTFPSVPLQHFSTKLLVRFTVDPPAALPQWNSTHGIF
jgi:hypothetical protein